MQKTKILTSIVLALFVCSLIPLSQIQSTKAVTGDIIFAMNNFDYRSQQNATLVLVHPSAVQYQPSSYTETFKPTQNGYLHSIILALGKSSAVSTTNCYLGVRIYNTTGYDTTAAGKTLVENAVSVHYQASNYPTGTFAQTSFYFSDTVLLNMNNFYLFEIYIINATVLDGQINMAFQATAGLVSGVAYMYEQSQWKDCGGGTKTADLCFLVNGNTEAPTPSPTPTPGPTATLRIFQTGLGSYTHNGSAPYHEGDKLVFTMTPSQGWNYTDFNYLNSSAPGLVSHISGNPLTYTVTATNSIGIVFENVDPDYNITPSPTEDPRGARLTNTIDSVLTIFFGSIDGSGIGIGIPLLIIAVLAILGAKFAGAWGFLVGLTVGIALSYVYLGLGLWAVVLVGIVDAVAVVKGMSGSGKADTASKET